MNTSPIYPQQSYESRLLAWLFVRNKAVASWPAIHRRFILGPADRKAVEAMAKTSPPMLTATEDGVSLTGHGVRVAEVQAQVEAGR